MKRIHVTSKEIKVLRNVRQMKCYKPYGLWYGIDNSWKDWCKSEMPEQFELYKYLYELKINISKILQIRTLSGLRRFANKYKVMIDESNFISIINWFKVSKEYYGIEINPHLWRSMFNTNYIWYYGWDCASGCIWNKKAIKNIKEK